MKSTKPLEYALKTSFERERSRSGMSELSAEPEARDMELAATRSSYEERKGNALASGADERRDKLRKASGSCK